MEKGSSSSSSSSSSSDSLNGLMFGKKIYFEGVGSEEAPPPPPPSPAKKGRVSAVQSGQPPQCQVEGCKVDLSDAKAYYSRHKVCGMHSKSPKVIVAGLEQRFCQQCSRFHLLVEFDQGKRSCRRRLAGHNERRRKPPPGSLLYPRYGSLSPSIYEDRSKAGGFVMDFSSYPSHPWPNTSSERGMGSQAAKYNLPLQSNSHNPLSDHLQGTTPATPRSNYSTTPLASPNGCFNGVSDSSYALSLLSTHPWGSRTTRSTGLGSSSFLGAQPPVNHGQFAAALHEMPPDLGLGQTSHAPEGHFTGGLGLAQPEEAHFNELDCSRGYDASLQHTHWSL